MYITILAWTGFAVLLLLCLPLAGMRKLILELTGIALRLTMIGLLIAGAILWFYPDQLPAQCAAMVNNSSTLSAILPEPGSQAFGLCATGQIVLLLLPLLMTLDVVRQFAGRRGRRLREMADGTEPVKVVTTNVVEPAPVVPVLPVATAEPEAATERRGPYVGERAGQRRAGRAEASETMSDLGNKRRPFRVADM